MSDSNTQVALTLADAAGFDHIQRVAKMYSESQLVPKTFQKNIPNVVIALEMASRIGASPMAVMQNLNVIHGRPSWSSQFIIAAINSCGRFGPLRFEVTPLGKKTVAYSYYVGFGEERQRKSDTIEVEDQKCIAWATEKATGDRVESAPVTIEMAVKEGWYTKSDSKWQTMPDLMIRYRAATFFGRMYAPEILNGLATQEESVDIKDVIDLDDPEAPEATAADLAKTETRGRKSDKGIASMKTVAPVPAEQPPVATEKKSETKAESPKTEPAKAEPAKKEPKLPATEPPKTEPAKPAAPAPATATAVEIVEPDPLQEMMDGKPNFELVDSVQRKIGIFEVQLKDGSKTISVFYQQPNGSDGKPDPAKGLPSVGALMECIFEDRVNKQKPGQTIRVISSFTVIGG